MNPYVKEIRPLPDYQLELTFENGETRVFDLKPYLNRGVFSRLADVGKFNSAHVAAGSVEWQGEIDLSYDTLYLESQTVEMTGMEGRTSQTNG